MISSTVARRIILSAILMGFFLSFWTLWWVSRGGAASWPTIQPAIERLLQVYVPLLGILAGFYFAEQSSTKGSHTSIEAFGFAMVLICVWVFAAPVLIFFSATIEAAIRLLNSISVLGTSLASSALAFFFSKSAGYSSGFKPKRGAHAMDNSEGTPR
jgi:hypothetical protein